MYTFTPSTQEEANGDLFVSTLALEIFYKNIRERCSFMSIMCVSGPARGQKARAYKNNTCLDVYVHERT